MYSGLFSQSNYGIVTKMGMTLMPNPGGHESFVGPDLLAQISQLLTITADVYIPKRRRPHPTRKSTSPLPWSPTTTTHHQQPPKIDRDHPAPPNLHDPRERSPAPPRDPDHSRPRPPAHKVLGRRGPYPARDHPRGRGRFAAGRLHLDLLRHELRARADPAVQAGYCREGVHEGSRVQEGRPGHAAAGGVLLGEGQGCGRR